MPRMEDFASATDEAPRIAEHVGYLTIVGLLISDHGIRGEG